jgi:hypothetical protein
MGIKITGKNFRFDVAGSDLMHLFRDVDPRMMACRALVHGLIISDGSSSLLAFD